MMFWAISLYFSILLLAAGCAKLEDRRPLLATLKAIFGKHQPIRIVMGRILPWFEILLAFAIASGIWPILTSSINTLAFCVFFVVKLYLRWRAPEVDCNCYGAATSTPVTITALLVGGIWLSLSVVLLWLTIAGNLHSFAFNPISTIVILLLGTTLIIRIFHRHSSGRLPVLVRPLIPYNEVREHLGVETQRQ